MDPAMANGDLEAARSGDRQALQRVTIRSRQDFLTIVWMAGPLGATHEAVKPWLHRAHVPVHEHPDS